MIQPTPNGVSPNLWPDALNRFDARQAKVPRDVLMDEWGDETARGRVDVDGYVDSGSPLQVVKRLTNGGYRFVLQRHGQAKRGDHGDRVFVDTFQNFFGGHDKSISCQWNLTFFHVEKLRKLVPADLNRAPDDIRGSRRCAGPLQPLTPAPFCGEAAQHTGLARPCGRAADRVGRRWGVPEVGQHMHAATFDFGCLRVLVLVDHVFVDALRHQLVDFRL